MGMRAYMQLDSLQDPQDPLYTQQIFFYVISFKDCLKKC